MIGPSLIVAWAGVAAAATAAPHGGRIALAEALAEARAAAPSLARLRALEQAAAEGRAAAAARRLPEVEASAGYSRSSHVPELTLELPGSPPRTLFPDLPDTWRARLGLSVPLWTGGRLESAIAAAGREREAATSDLRVAAADLELEVTASFWRLVNARAEVAVLDEAIRAYAAHAREARDRLEAGLAARNETLAVEVEWKRAEQARVDARAAARAAASDLARLLGRGPDAVLEPVEPEPGPEPALPELRALLERARRDRPEYPALRARAEAFDARARATGAAGRPQAIIAAGWDHANPNRRIAPPVDEFRHSWDAGVSLGWRVFDGGRTRAEAARERALAAAARAALEDLDRRVAHEVAVRLAELEAARSAVEVAAAALALAEENRRVTEDRYREGLAPSSELLDAEAALLRAGLERTRARSRVAVAAAGLTRAVGGQP